ncbi:MAG: hypothetical protein V4454_01320 [Pseudomonadota bacterium]
MAETANISQIANKIANDIFKIFFWEMHSQQDTNFECVSDDHKTENGGKKLTHPGDVVFHYVDPYLNKRIYLHTDLKSYKKSTLQQGKIRDSLKSLAMTVECAAISDSWRQKFLAIDQEVYEVRGLLFVANHDGKAAEKFTPLLSGIAKANIPVAKGQILHVLGPSEITSLYSIATDIKLAIADKKLSPFYRFFYPDLTLWKRHTADDQRIGATIEMLLSPYFILKHPAITEESNTVLKPGSLVYYSRAGDTVDEFVYLLDSLSRYQLVNSREQIRVVAFKRERSTELKNNFEKAKHRYCKMWGFEGDRETEIQSITIDALSQIAPNYTPDDIGWRI